MLKNKNGTVYKLNGSVQQFNNSENDFELLNLWDQEAIMRGGSPIYYYEVIISQNTIDPIYLESRNKLFSNFPIELWANYEPVRSQNNLSRFGIDSQDEIRFELNYKSTLNIVGHPLKIGSRIHTPHLGENWVIVQKNLSEFKLWGALRLELVCQKFQENVTTGEGNVTQETPNMKIKIN